MPLWDFVKVMVLWLKVKYLNKKIFSRTFSTQSHEECRNYENLTKNQFKVCLKAPDVTKAAMKGMAIALKECQYQVRLLLLLHVTP